MNKTVLATSTALIFLFSGATMADEKRKDDKNEKLATKIQELRSQYSTAELLSALDMPEQDAGVFHGMLGTGVEFEQTKRGDGVNEGKIKYTLIQGNFRHDTLPGWDFGFYSGREELYNGELTHATYDRGVNAIQEIYVNRSYGLSRGSLGWGVKLASESIDERTTPEAKLFGTYQISPDVEFHGYGLYHVEYKRGTGEFPYWEIEPGFGFKFTDTSGAWLNFRYQVGQWRPKSGDGEIEKEWIIKPGIWFNSGKLSYSFWGEFGSFVKTRDSNSAHLWTEDYAKLGVSGNYEISKSWRLFSEASYKKLKYQSGENRERFNGYIPLFIIGVNYTF
ncbi:OmpG porin family protein [Enterobacter cloacae complex sp. 2024EL-00215]|uniref:OmpG porin family protein n=1 Tax=unclassified Enterobacter cloacae complex TaxID=2757714 RepID=UPI00375223F0